eukprot:scpid70710/ scgid13131/ 
MQRRLSVLALGVWTVCGLLFDVVLLWPGTGRSDYLCRATFPWKRDSSAEPVPIREAGTAAAAATVKNGKDMDDTMASFPSAVHQHKNQDKVNTLTTRDAASLASVSRKKLLFHEKAMKRRQDFFTMIIDLTKNRRARRLPIIHGVKSLRHELSVYLLASIEPSYTCDVQERFGKMGDGGKVICNPNQHLSSENCLVYSYGSRLDCSFELDIRQQYPNCELHVFDPAPSVTSRYSKSQCANSTQFHAFGLGGYSQRKDIQNKSVPLKTYTQAKKELQHEEHRIHVLKMDIEGDEFDAIQEMFDSDALINTALVTLEVHVHAMRGGTIQRAEQFMQLFNNMNRLGFLVYHKELNWLWGRGNAEFSFVHKSLLPEFQEQISNDKKHL